MPGPQQDEKTGQQEGNAAQQKVQAAGQQAVETTGPQKAERAGQQGEETKDLAYYIRFARRHPWGALAAVVLAVIIAFATGLGQWIADKAKGLAQSGCESVGLCEAPAPPVALPWEIKFSTAVPHCLTGRLTEKLRDWSPPVSWEAGADRLVICADATIEGPKQDIPRLIQERFPRCINVEQAESSIAVRTQLEASPVCRAPYRYDGDVLVDAPLRAGLFVCFPGANLEGAGSSFSFEGGEVPVCSEDIMKEYNFISR